MPFFPQVITTLSRSGTLISSATVSFSGVTGSGLRNTQFNPANGYFYLIYQGTPTAIGALTPITQAYNASGTLVGSYILTHGLNSINNFAFDSSNNIWGLQTYSLDPPYCCSCYDVISLNKFDVNTGFTTRYWSSIGPCIGPSYTWVASSGANLFLYGQTNLTSVPVSNPLSTNWGLIFAFDPYITSVVYDNGYLYATVYYSANAIYIIKLDASTGSSSWAYYLNPSAASTGNFLNGMVVSHVDANGDIYMSGSVTKNYPYYYDAWRGVVVVKINSGGTLQWARQIYSTDTYGTGGTISYADIEGGIMGIRGKDLYINTAYKGVSPPTFNAARSCMMKVPTNGSLTQSFTIAGRNIVYENLSLTLSSSTLSITSGHSDSRYVATNSQSTATYDGTSVTTFTPAKVIL